MGKYGGALVILVIGILGVGCYFTVKHFENNQAEIGYSFEVPVLEGSTHIKIDKKRINLDGFQYFYSWSGSDNRSIEIRFQDNVLTCKKTRLTSNFIIDPHYFYLRVEYLKQVEYGFIVLDKMTLEGELYAG